MASVAVMSHDLDGALWEDVSWLPAVDDVDVVVVALQQSDFGQEEDQAIEALFQGYTVAGCRRSGGMRTWVFGRDSKEVSIVGSASDADILIVVIRCGGTFTAVANVCWSSDGTALTRSDDIRESLRLLSLELLRTSGVAIDETLGHHWCDLVVIVGNLGYRLADDGTSEDRSAFETKVRGLFECSDWQALSALDELETERRLGRIFADYQMPSGMPTFLGTSPAYASRILWRGRRVQFFEWTLDRTSSPHVPLSGRFLIPPPTSRSRKLKLGKLEVRRLESRGAARVVVISPNSVGTSTTTTAANEDEDGLLRWDDQLTAQVINDDLILSLVDDSEDDGVSGSAALDLAALKQKEWIPFSAALLRVGRVIGEVRGQVRLEEEEDAQRRLLLKEDELQYTRLLLKRAENHLEEERRARCRAEKRAYEALMAKSSIPPPPPVIVSAPTTVVDTSANFLRSIPLFKGFSEAQLAKAHEAFERREYANGEPIIAQGNESGDDFFLVARGRVRVTVASEGRSKQVAMLSVGDYFGERALVLKEPRASTCVADGDVSCLTLDRDSFEDVVMMVFSPKEKRELTHHPSSPHHHELRSALSNYDHDLREGSKANLEAFVTRYSDLLPVAAQAASTEESSEQQQNEDPKPRGLEIVQKVLQNGDPTLRVLPPEVDATLRLCVLDAVAPELSMFDLLDRVAGIAGLALDAATEVCCPVDVETRRLVDASTGAERSWDGIAAACAEAGAPRRTALCEEQALAVPVKYEDKVVAVLVARHPRTVESFTALQELGIRCLADRLAELLDDRQAELDFVLGHKSYVDAADVSTPPAVAIGKIRVSPPPPSWACDDLLDDDDDVDDEDPEDEQSSSRRKRKKKKKKLHREDDITGPAAALKLYDTVKKRATQAVILRVALVHGDVALTRVWESKPTTLAPETQSRPSITASIRRLSIKKDDRLTADLSNEKVRFVRDDDSEVALRHLPPATTMRVSVHTTDGKGLAFAKVPLWNEHKVLRGGTRTVPLARGSADTRHAKVEGPVYTSRSAPCVVELHISSDDVLFTTWDDDVMNDDDDEVDISSSQSERPPSLFKVKTLLEEHVLYKLTDEDREVLWRARRSLTTHAEALPKLLLTVDWTKRSVWREATHRLLDQWAMMPPLEALQLLSPRFPDPRVRAYAVRCLEGLNDAELAAAMLQLAQVVKFERDHDTSLNRFLLRRALRNPTVCGHALYWSLATERDHSDEHHCCRVLLDLYARACSEYRVKLGHQVLLVAKLADIATRIKHLPSNSHHNEASSPKKSSSSPSKAGKHGALSPPNPPEEDHRTMFLRRELENIVLPPSFQLPLSPFMVCRGLDLKRCKVMGSAQKPLWLTFHNAVKGAKPHIVIFKCGDDLRQDQLTLQILRSMDTMWKAAGLDLRMSPYGCVATAADQGFIEVVPHAMTLAGITAETPTSPTFRLSRKVSAAKEAYYGHDAVLNWITRESRAFDGSTATTMSSPTTRNVFAEDNHRHKGLSSRHGRASMYRLPSVAASTAALLKDDDYAGSARRVLTEDLGGKKLLPWQRSVTEEVNPLTLGGPVASALDDFSRSLAGYCVATYVLGVGDRHNDNIMVMKTGRLLHIDFGHFLGNYKEKFGIKRETAPFVLTPHFERVLGGQEKGAHYRRFEELASKAFLILRHHRDLILTLLVLMAGCGLPELEDPSDLDWVLSALMVNKSEADALNAFLKLIDASLHCKRTRTMHAIHSFVHTS